MALAGFTQEQLLQKLQDAEKQLKDEQKVRLGAEQKLQGE